jgi:hypothetical protein
VPARLPPENGPESGIGIRGAGANSLKLIALTFL